MADFSALKEDRIPYGHYKDNIIKTQDVTQAVVKAWYQLVLELTRTPTGQHLTWKGSTQNKKDLVWPAPAQRWARSPHPKGVPKSVWKWPPATSRGGKPKKGWLGSCWQFAAKLIQLMDMNLAGVPTVPFPDDAITASRLSRKGGTSKYRTQYATDKKKDNFISPALTFGYCSLLEKVRTSNGKLFGAGNNIKDLSKLGILPGMAVHVCMDWDNKLPDDQRKYTLTNSFHHWIVYVGQKNGTHYYADSFGIRSAEKCDQWLKKWATGRRKPNYNKPKFEKLRKYFLKKYDNKLAGKNNAKTLREIDKYSAQPLVRWVGTPYPIS
jgi:hypothetical protein